MEQRSALFKMVVILFWSKLLSWILHIKGCFVV